MNTPQVEASFIEGQKGKQDALMHYNKQQIDQLNDLIRYLGTVNKSTIFYREIVGTISVCQSHFLAEKGCARESAAPYKCIGYQSLTSRHVEG